MATTVPGAVRGGAMVVSPTSVPLTHVPPFKGKPDRVDGRLASGGPAQSTAALDARAEYEVFQRFAELTKGKSAVLISHRFSTARLADRILVLDQGTVLEAGTHEELLIMGGRYAELFNLQAMGYQ